MHSIAVVTGTRAEYGLLRGIIRRIDADPTLSLRLMVTGSHLSPRHGLTYREIESDGFRIADRIDLALDGDTPADIAHALAHGLAGFADAFAKARPDIVVILGDRYELLAVAQAAMLFRVPLAHIHGGEITEGAIDDAIRHSLTKMSYLHFTTAAPYRDRVIQLGEPPERVFNVGGPGNEDLADPTPPSLDDLEALLKIKLDGGYFLVTYHPETLASVAPAAAVAELLAALDQFPDVKVIVTGVNADPGNRAVSELFEAFARGKPNRVRIETSLGRRRYLGAMKHCLAVVGNSSSGVIEAPLLGVASVNIGARQRGRLRSPSVIDCGESREDIAAAIRRAMSLKSSVSAASSSQFGKAADDIVRILRETAIEMPPRKTFYDLPAWRGGG
jgi:UDP-hydrolysing UDP-N-acetyl-D-glucosamine 2-epimerase